MEIKQDKDTSQESLKRKNYFVTPSFTNSIAIEIVSEFFISEYKTRSFSLLKK